VDRPGPVANLVRVGVALVGLACAIVMWSIVHGSGTFTTQAGRSDLAATLFVAAGLGLIAAGLVTGLRRYRIGVLSVLAGVVWFAPVWDGWERGPAIVREAGMLTSSFVFPMLLHLVIAVARPVSRFASFLIGTTYALAGLGAVVLALVRDPYLDPHCWINCTTDLLVVSARPRLASAVVSAGLWITAVAAVALVAVCLSWSLVPTTRRRYGPVLLGGVLLGLATVARSLITIRHGYEDPSARSLASVFLVSCVATLLVASGLLWSLLFSRRVRRAVARVVARLDDAPELGSLESALVDATGDPDLRLSYWLPALAHYSDAHGRPVSEPLSGAGKIATPVNRHGDRVAVISHTSDGSELERALGSDLRLALDNERLQAEVLAQMNDVRDSRARIVEAGDERRRRLERDLHDGAQQSLLGLSYDLRVARAAAASNGEGELTMLIDSALTDVGEAFAELRDLAHGIFPAVLTQAGVGAAVAALAETSTIAVDVSCKLTERLPTAVETTVYVIVADGLKAAAEADATNTTVTIDHRENHVDVVVTPDRANVFSDMTHAADRVGAIGGTFHIDATGLWADIPCA
jgi:signal transduction histidine kinase